MPARTGRTLAAVAAGLAVVAALVLAGDAGAFGKDDDEYRLSSLRVFNRVVLLVKEQYVEPDRIDPREMLLAALDSVEKSVPEVLVEEGKTVDVRCPEQPQRAAPPCGKMVQDVTIVVGDERRTFPLDDVTTLWELSFKLRDVFRFLETRISTDVDRRDVEYAATNGMLGKLDPHSVLLEPKFSQEMKLNTKGEFGGLGIVISIRDGNLTVISPIDGTPADKAGIKAQDKIVKIGEESTVNMGLDEAVERLRGKPGTSVVIWVLRKGWEEPQRFEIVRDVIKVDSVTHQLLDGDQAAQPGSKIGYVKIKQFQGHSADDVLDAVKAMEKEAGKRLAGIILDLRNNPGGLLDQSVEVSNLFIKDGVVVVTQEGGGDRRELKAQPKNMRIDLPLVVLVNGGSASASEIVAGAIKNRNRGLIVGDQTFGKGSVQQLYDFPDGSSLKLTIGQYLTPGDESIQSVGITPDIEILPISADNKESLNLFPDTRTREEDLERHLDDARTKHRESAYSLAYLAESLDNDERERRDASTKFQEDFEIGFARRLLGRSLGGAGAPIVPRDEMIGVVKPVVDAVSAEEEQKIDAALLKLGVDWSKGAAAAGGKLAVKVVKAEPVTAGTSYELVVQAKNVGTAPLYRVRGTTTSTLGLLYDHELLFGKIDPGQAREWTMNVKMPKDITTRRDLLRIAFADEHARLDTTDVAVETRGLSRPRFSYALFVDDSRDGNGDGLLQVGESVDLVVSIKNTGDGASEEPMAFLKNLGGAEAFIETGRQKLEPLKPGSSGVARFGFKVQPPQKDDVAARAPDGPRAPGVATPANKVTLRLQVFDAVTGDVLVEKLTMPIKGARADVKKKKGVVEATAATTILAAAEPSSQVLAKISGGTRLDAVAEVNGFVRVKIGNLFGYVPSSGVGPAKGKAIVDATGEPQGLSWVYGRDPPRITFPRVQDGLAVVDGDTYTVEAKIDDDGPVSDVYVFSGDQKVRYERLGSKGPTSSTVRHEVKLKPGVNIITIVAREDDEFAQREAITVYSTKGNPLAEEEAKLQRAAAGDRDLLKDTPKR